MRIQHNIMAMNAYRNYNTNTSALSKNLEKLSSGYKINRAGDDAAGLAISEKMRAQITGLNAAQKNVKDGISLVKTAEGAMQEIQDMLNRMDYLATQSANGTYDDPVDRKNLQKEVDALKSEINRIADSANFNGIKLLDGSLQSTAATNVNATVGLTAASTAGSQSAGGTITLADTDFSNPHVGGKNVPQATVSFTLDLSGVSAKVSTGIQTVTVNVAGKDVAVTVAAGNVTAASVAAAFNTKEFDFGGGITMTATGSNDGKVVFTLKAGSEYTATAAGTMNGKLGDKPTVTITGANVSEVKTELSEQHGLQDITYAQAKEESPLAGIDFDLAKDGLIAHKNTLTIGNKTFIFQTDKSDNLTAATGQTVINVSGVDKNGWVKEAVKQITTATNGAFTNEKDGTTVNFRISSTAPGKIHIDQQPQTGSTANPSYSEDDLKKLFSAVANPKAASAGTMDLTANVSADVADGDRVSFGDGKTYVITSDTDKQTAAADIEDAKEVYISAADFNTRLAAYAKDQADATLNGDVFTIDKSVAGTTTITTKNAADYGVKDTETELTKVKTAYEEALKGIKITKLTTDDAGKAGLKLQIGDTSDTFNQLSVVVGNMHTAAMGTMETAVEGSRETPMKGKSIADIDISTAEGAHDAIDVIKNAINYVSSIRGDLGATQNRLEHTANNLSVMAENIQDAESTIRDTDVAEEMMAYTKNNILVQSAQAMLAQANAVPQGVLQLLG